MAPPMVMISSWAEASNVRPGLIWELATTTLAREQTKRCRCYIFCDKFTQDNRFGLVAVIRNG
jgi:hypothetical protein